MENNLFETASRNKIRFNSDRGELTVEQLWDLPLRSRNNFNLDEVAKGINKKLKEISEESFVEIKRSVANSDLNLSFDIVKYIIGVKKAEEDAAAESAKKKLLKAQLMELKEKKQTEKLMSMSEEDIDKQLASL